MPQAFADEAELAQGGYPEFDLEAFRSGDLTPVFFGSALKNFGVEELIAAIDRWAPPPRPQPSEDGLGASDGAGHTRQGFGGERRHRQSGLL